MTGPEKLHLEQMRMLDTAVELLNQADTLVQKALGSSNKCYSIYTRINDIMDELEELSAEPV